MVWIGRTVRVLELEELVPVHTLVAGAVSVSFGPSSAPKASRTQGESRSSLVSVCATSKRKREQLGQLHDLPAAPSCLPEVERVSLEICGRHVDKGIRGRGGMRIAVVRVGIRVGSS